MLYVNVKVSYSSPSFDASKAGRSNVAQQTYTISELAKEFGVTTRTIRFYEEKGYIHPQREGNKRLFSAADRVRIQLILRGKRIGLSLQECVEVIDMYDPMHNNADQLHSLKATVQERRALLERQQTDINDMLQGLAEVEALCEQALKNAEADNTQHG